MPFEAAGGSGGGGGGVTLGPAQNEFGDTTTANKAAAETLRNTYATANATWLAQYNGDRAFIIRLVWTGNAQAFQRRNAAGSAWEDVTSVAPGTPGRSGNQARFLVYGYDNAAIIPSAAPTGGTFVQSTDTLTLPTGYTAAATTPGTGEVTYRIQAEVNPAVDANTVNLVWSVPAEDPGYTAAGLAEGYADDAAASAVEAAADAALVDSYDGAVPILENAALESNNLDVTVPSWRDYDFIQVVVRDSNATEQIDRPAPQIPTAGLDTYGESRVPFNNNDELRLESTAGSDVIQVNITGWSGHPATGDVITFYGIRSGVEAGGGGGGGGGLSQAEVDARVAAGVLDPAETANTDAWGVDKGGTGAKTAAAALTALGGLTQAEVDARALARFTAAEKTKLAGIAAGATALTLTDVLTAILAGTDIDIDRAVAGQITISYDAGGPDDDHTRRASISTDTTLSQAEYDAGATSDDQDIVIPTWTSGTRYVFLGVPTDEDDISDIEQNGISVFGGFEAVTGDLFSHKWWRTSAAQSILNSGITYRIIQ